MLHLLHKYVKKNFGGSIMDITRKRVISLIVVIIVAAVLGRLAVRAFMNLLLGGTMFGGDLL